MTRPIRTADDSSVTPQMARKMYRRTLSGWAVDLLSSSRQVAWGETSVEPDWQDRDWRSLYTGSVLDD